MDKILFLDFESYYDSSSFTLKKLSVLEYVRSPEYKTHGVGYAYMDGSPHWITGDHVIRAFFQTIDWANTVVVAHNVKFDGAILAWHYGIKPKGYICTQAMARAMLGYKVKSHSLAAVSEHFGFEPKGMMHTDGVKDLTPQQADELGVYCKHDVFLCREIFKTLSITFPASQYQALGWTIRAFLEPELQLDGDTLKQVHEAEKLRRETIIKDIGIPKSVFSSNDKFAKLLAEKGFIVPMKKSPTAVKKGIDKEIPALATGDQAFIDMRNSGSPELEALCEARVAAKSNLLETRSEKFLGLVKYGRFPFDVQFSGAKQTHRYSGAAGAGGNPQNLPRGSGLRKAITAPAGHCLLVADFAAIEARIVAWLAREPKLIEDFSADRDVYSAFSTRIYGRTITKADKRERQFGKTCILGLGYGMGAKKFAYKVRLDTGMVIDPEEAKRVVTLYRVFYSRVPALWEVLDHYIPFLAGRTFARLPGIPFLTFKAGSIVLPSGLQIQYPNLRWDAEAKTPVGKGQWIYDVWDKGHLEKRHLYGGKILENVSQALAGELTKLAIERAEANGVKVAGQVHDEALAVVANAMKDHGKVVMQRAMEEPPVWWPTLKMKAEVGVGPNWLEAKV